MKIFRFDSETGRKIDHYGSTHFSLSAIARLKAEARVSCAHLGPNGVVGFHQAAAPQLFLVVQGEGWVRDETSERIPVLPGQAVFWDKGEWHESSSGTGLMAIIIESDRLDPAELMPVR